MRYVATLAGCAAAAVLLAGCAYDEGYHHHGEMAVGVDYDGFYDDYYGPVADGYWGPDDFFYYTDAPGHPFRRDESHHFRHDAAEGFHPVHGHHAGPVPAGRGG